MTEIRHHIVGNTISLFPDGTFTIEILKEIVQLIDAAENKTSRRLNRFVDLRKIQSEEFRFDDIEPFSWLRKGRLKEMPGGAIKLAILVDGPLKYGLARMYEILMEMDNVEIQVFKELSAAAGWLGVDESSLAGE